MLWIANFLISLVVIESFKMATSGTTTFNLDQKSLDVVKSFAEKITDKNIILENNINEEIVGGFNLKIGDRMIDCTVSSKLKNLRKKLINN